MAARKPIRKAVAAAVQYTCRDCANSYDFHERGWDGKPFLCRCPFYKDGKFSMFLTDKACKDHFILRIHGTSE